MKTSTGAYIFPLKKHEDDRGWLIELFRNDQLFSPVEMGYISETKPGVIRGPHEHREQTDHFVFIGPGTFHLHLWGESLQSRYGVYMLPPYEVWEVGETNPVLVIVPPGVVHAYKNISDGPGWVFNAPDKLYAGPGKLYEVDEIRHEESEHNPYKLYEGDGWVPGGNAGDKILYKETS